MDHKIKLKILGDREKIHEFYYSSLGDMIKKTRIEKKLTQEYLAKGICSNTYISKIENNKINPNKEQLLLIMEKMDMPTDTVGLPEEMVESLERSVQYFFYKDIQSYKALFQQLERYEFGVLIYIIRLGYYVLTEDFESARLLYDDMYRYLNSLEEFGFAIFVIYAGFYNIAIQDYHTARNIIDSSRSKLRNDEILFSLFSFMEFIVCGHLKEMNRGRDALAFTNFVFTNHGNCRRLSEISMYLNIFKIYENNRRAVTFNPETLPQLNASDINYYMIMLAQSTEEPNQYFKYLRKDGRYYLEGLFFQARFYYKNQQLQKYKETKQKINQYHYQLQSRVDYLNLLKLMEEKDLTYLREYLIHYVLPYVREKQNLYFLKMASEMICEILTSRKRYKDSLNYHKKCEEFQSEINQ